MLVGGGGERLTYHPASTSSGYIIFGLSSEYYVEGPDFGVEKGVVLLDVKGEDEFAVSTDISLIYVLEYIQDFLASPLNGNLKALIDQWVLKGGKTPAAVYGA